MREVLGEAIAAGFGEIAAQGEAGRLERLGTTAPLRLRKRQRWGRSVILPYQATSERRTNTVPPIPSSKPVSFCNPPNQIQAIGRLDPPAGESADHVRPDEHQGERVRHFRNDSSSGHPTADQTVAVGARPRQWRPFCPSDVVGGYGFVAI